MSATNGASRALYHAHPTNIVALTQVLPLDDRTFTRALWTSFSESMVAFPQGIGVGAVDGTGRGPTLLAPLPTG